LKNQQNTAYSKRFGDMRGMRPHERQVAGGTFGGNCIAAAKYCGISNCLQRRKWNVIAQVIEKMLRYDEPKPF
jgi:hypothetical protein